MLTILVPILVLVVGALAYGISKNPEVKEMGRIAFFCGLFVLTWQLGSDLLHFPK
jgi:Na+/phosphate symporter